jgi:glyoxylase-like metal-dependent hydrolase (beta-lactamase superfamily II)
MCDDNLFTGDTLFRDSCGRTDLPGGNGAEIFKSLRRLAALPGDYRVLPGHGMESTLEEERENNPYMQ